MFNSLALLIKHQGWARAAKLLYFVQRHQIDGVTKEEIMKESIEEHGLFQTRSFENIWNLYDKIKSDINYYEQHERKTE